MTATRNRRFVAPLLAMLALIAAPFAGAAVTLEDNEEKIYLWPGRTAPGSLGLGQTQAITERSKDPSVPDRIITGVSQPYLVVYRPKRSNGTALLVTPGGSYERIVLDKEGTVLVPPFVDEGGVTLFVLRYRLPDPAHAEGANAPLADAQRAMRLLRTRAAEWGIDPTRIGVMGFSAGGHVAASLGTRFDESVYTPVDAYDRNSARPDFMALVYPVIDMGEHAHGGSRVRLLSALPASAGIAAYSLQNRITAATPPTFLLHASDDDVVSVENSLLFFDALRRANVPAELHVYPMGGHGFGIRGTRGLSLEEWPQLALTWMSSLQTQATTLQRSDR
ncbi:alpha/beta hydrolase [Pseudoxanthomonas sp. UTMC 1351]|uniref:alpha/beta hydrolase n=1 Tax=Pseudoxanthomonas sp. UTMC 1351 TaxID=2695853 RepID=UPI0034CE2EAA